MPRKKIYPKSSPSDDAIWLAFETLNKFEESALITAEKVEKYLGIDQEYLAALEEDEVLLPEGDRVVGGVKKYALKKIILARANLPLLDAATRAIQKRNARKNAKKLRQRDKKDPLIPATP